MPELPEMQALAERLDAALAGAPVARISPLSFAGLKTAVPPYDSLVGRTVEGVGRRGKYLVWELGGPRLIIHLSQGGRVDVEDPPKTTKPRGAVVRIGVEGRPAVLVKEFGTERKAGWWVVAEGDEGPLEGLGPEVLDGAFAEHVRTSGERRRIHTLLRDQRTVAGVGRGYAVDSLHRARLSPFAPLASLDAEERERLLTGLREVLEEGLAVERKRTGGLPPKVGDHWIVHHRFGTPCPTCGDELKRVSYESYEITYCPACQTGGKVLADRRLSRLVR